MFRQEALNQKKWKSTAVLISAIPSWLIVFISFSIIIIFILFITLSSYTRRENVVGEIVMQSYPIIISSSKSGYVSERYVSLHQQVKKGDPLFKIKLDRITSSGEISSNSIQALREQIKATDRAILLLKNNKGKTIQSLDKQIKNNQKIKQDKILYLSELEDSTQDYAELVNRYEKLLKIGYSNNDEVNVQRARYFQQKSLVNEIKQDILQIQSNILNLENEIETRKTDFDNQIIRYNIQKSDLNIRLMELESVSDLTIISPVDGFIESISATLGQIVKEGDPLSQIIPADKGNYQLVLWVPNSAISFLKKNDKVNIRYEAFPFEKFGQFEGVIQSISTLPASLQELAFYNNLPQSAEQNIPLYKVIVDIQDQYVQYNDTILYFMSGMKAEATLFLEKRKLYEWILFPFYNLTKNMGN
ncbi:hypothetical protein AM305_02152 [Actinobacillus minor NM305]|uniref:Uncharacterized protein n=1 Tax=Actinobacillus minor NM305 TaxID=637911 RepID=C5S446_9PAST|nr:HlyD family efflux transporter periplasmic adaptor subunit [Actinobacillus minor]EER46326.1 hypothetical protein AM305_02152 [Actinobacillus minor NM305]MDY5106364.1 HlyD family efflux transporter periplasmic adaptor subunit [Actinobacillus minor]